MNDAQRGGRRRRAKKAKPPAAEPAEASKALPPPGLPDPDSVVAEETLTSPSGARYRIVHTDETDSYDQPEPPPPPRRRAGKRQPK